MEYIWLVTEHDMNFTSPITRPGEQTGIAATSVNAAKRAIEEEYGGKIIRERNTREDQVIVLVSSAPLSETYNAVLSITKFQVFTEAAQS